MRRDPVISVLLVLSLLGLLGIVNLTLGGKKLPTTSGEHTQERAHSLSILAREAEQSITPSSLGTLASLIPTKSLGNLRGKVVVDAFVSLSDRHQSQLVSVVESLVKEYPQLMGLRIFDADTPEGLRERTRAGIAAPGILVNGEPIAYKPIAQYTLSEVKEKVLAALKK